MGSEASCRLQVGDRTSEGKALLEADELIFRGDFRLRIALKSIKRVEVEGGTLVIATGDGTLARFEIGKIAARWAEKIQSPPSLLDKLGINAESDVALVGSFEDAFVSQVAARARSADARRPTIAFLAASSRGQLARIATQRRRLRDDAALWIVYPKGHAEIREADVIAAGRAAGLKDVKVARFSETHTALKFVIPVVERAEKKPKTKK